MNCEPCSNGMASNLMSDMCGTEIRNSQCAMDDRAAPEFAPKGHDKPAWGNAPGPWLRNHARALKGRDIRRIGWDALSGLMKLLMMFTQGVALGWFVIAPSGRIRPVLLKRA